MQPHYGCDADLCSVLIQIQRLFEIAVIFSIGAQADFVTVLARSAAALGTVADEEISNSCVNAAANDCDKTVFGAPAQKFFVSKAGIGNDCAHNIRALWPF